MSKNFELSATVRHDKGKGASRRLRRESNQVPGIIYGTGGDPVPLAVPANELNKALESEAFYSQILSINIDGKKEQAVLKDLQRHAYKRKILHLDLQRVSATETLQRNVPLHLVGAEDAPGVKVSGGVISHHITEVEVRCLPAALPPFIELDISELELNNTLHLSHLTAPENVEFVALTLEEPQDLPVVSINEPKEVSVEEEAPAEGEAGAEGEGGAEAGEGGEEGGEADKGSDEG